METSPLNKNIFYYEIGETINEGPGWRTIVTQSGWYYHDETGALAGGPYANDELALFALQIYAKNL